MGKTKSREEISVNKKPFIVTTKNAMIVRFFETEELALEAAKKMSVDKKKYKNRTILVETLNEETEVIEILHKFSVR